MKYIYNIIVLLLIFSLSAYGQEEKRKNYFPVWTFHQKNINIHGLSLGLWSLSEQPRNTNTNGIKLELIGAGLLIGLMPCSPIPTTDSAYNSFQKNNPIDERINGIYLSPTGPVCNCKVNGIIAGGFGLAGNQTNGISVSLLNYMQSQNGLQIGVLNEIYILNGIQLGFRNKAMKHRGIQIGLWNKSKKLHGIQIGLWNINQKRKLPLINWNFSYRKICDN